MKHYATTIKNAHRAKRYAKIRAALMSALMTIGVLFCTGITAFRAEIRIHCRRLQHFTIC